MATARKKFSGTIPALSKLNLEDDACLAENWKRFKRSWNNYEIASNLKAESKEYRCAVFLTMIGDAALQKLEGFAFGQNESENDIDVVLNKFEEFCVGSTHEAFESYRFNVRNQLPNESIDAYVAELRKLAKGCNYGDQEDRMIRDRILVGTNSAEVQKELLKNTTLNLKIAIETARSHEASKHQLQEMSKDVSVDRIAKKGKPRPKFSNEKQNFDQKRVSDKCTRCGRDRHKRKEDCRALTAECHKCSKIGHYSDFCFSKNKQKHDKPKIRYVDEEEVPILGSISTEINTVDSWHADLLVNSQKMSFRIDTGADVTVIPDRCFMKTDCLVKTDKRLYGPGGAELDCIGVFKATIESKNNKSEQDLYVVKGLKKPLLGRPAIEALGILKRVEAVGEGQKDIKKEYPTLFNSPQIGKIDKPYTIRLSEEARPFSIATPRRLPLPMKDMVEEELKNLQEQGIIRQVTKPTDWCAPIVVVPKSTPGKVRICVDYTKLNESVKRENFPLPTTDQLLAQLDGATVFSKLDCNKGFHQVPLAEESQELTTFITPFGRFCYTRLPFGISSGPEIFHREMTHILAGVPGVIVDIDDVLIGGKGNAEHDERLRQVLERMKEAGVTLNEKCELATKKIKFLGHIITPEGISIDPEKVQAVADMPAPTDVPSLRRLLGMVNHVGKFAPNLAEVTQPLRELLKKDNDWTWGPQQQTAFETVKRLLTTSPTLQHYNPNKPTRVSADACTFGLGSVLLQKDEEGWKPVFYASRSLTDTEQRYAQIEKEALAMTWACERFEDFLVGLKNFTIETDHKPLLSLMKSKALDLLTPRIQRFRMRMMRFSYELEFVAGKNLATADTLSRAPGSQPGQEDRKKEEETHAYVSFVSNLISISDSRLEEVRQEQDKDRECSAIKTFVQDDHWPESSKKDYPQYFLERHSFSIQGGLLLMGNRLVIPQVLRKEMLERIHQGHQGIVKCRALARSCIWWPGLSKEIASLVENCPACEKFRSVPPEPLNPTPTPDYAWQKVGSDIFDWQGENYLLLVDYYSRWIEVSHLSSITSALVIRSFKAIFAKFGIPEVVFSDNGTQYSSNEFARFSEYWGFMHDTSSPHHPSGNGEAERAVQTVKNLLKKEQDPFLALLNYRNTPLSSGKSPAELMFGRPLRTRIPLFRKQDKTADAEFRRRDTVRKAKMKADYDRLHRAKPLPQLNPGQPVWLKSPKTEEGVVLPGDSQNKRSVPVQSSSGRRTRRNRAHLRVRKGQVPVPSLPKDTTSLPTLGKPETVDSSPQIPDFEETVNPMPNNATSVVNPAQPRTVTRSGRVVKPLVKESM